MATSKLPPENRPSSPAPPLDPDEPVFILRAGDLMAPQVVMEWVDLAVRFGVPSTKVRAAISTAKQMERWRARKRP